MFHVSLLIAATNYTKTTDIDRIPPIEQDHIDPSEFAISPRRNSMELLSMMCGQQCSWKLVTCADDRYSRRLIYPKQTHYRHRRSHKRFLRARLLHKHRISIRRRRT
ncbi:hypothetical protein FIBSPDRAFT_1046847 [Athelia psychrophila]|uniref:Uncharacterized protein n=1 Tax=Athelia psychrophila TaxID=1759441 RepID=A0A166G754_9AGAM|nr:hypothetical protein FIBSPDRAFT_1046847 [Fibularhizoctonia sp. CBS 109695]